MSTRILGVDPGLTRCGLGAVAKGQSRQLQLLEVDVIRTGTDTDLGDRLLQISEQLDAWIARIRPDMVAVEQVFAQHNVRTITGTAQVAGLAMVAARRAGIGVAVHTPSEVKAAVTGHGRAQKEQVQEMVRRILSLPLRPQPADAADALALAITHAWRSHASGRLASAGVQTTAQQAWAAAEAKARTQRGPSLAARRRRVRAAGG